MQGHIYPKNVYELREALFEKLEGFSLPVSEGNKLFSNFLAIFDLDRKKCTNFTLYIIKSD